MFHSYFVSALRLDLIRLLQKHSHEQFITVAMVNSIRRHYRGRLDRVKELFTLAVEYGAGEIVGGPSPSESHVARLGGPRTNPMRLKLTLSSMGAAQRQELKVLTGGAQQWQQVHSQPNIAGYNGFLDFGGVWKGVQHACVPLHLAISIAVSKLPTIAKMHLTDECWRVATTADLPLDITPRPDGPPKTLWKLHTLLSQSGATLQIYYLPCFGHHPRYIITLGSTGSGAPLLPPLMVSLALQHCCLGHASFQALIAARSALGVILVQPCSNLHSHE